MVAYSHILNEWKKILALYFFHNTSLMVQQPGKSIQWVFVFSDFYKTKEWYKKTSGFSFFKLGAKILFCDIQRSEIKLRVCYWILVTLVQFRMIGAHMDIKVFLVAQNLVAPRTWQMLMLGMLQYYVALYIWVFPVIPTDSADPRVFTRCKGVFQHQLRHTWKKQANICEWFGII